MHFWEWTYFYNAFFYLHNAPLHTDTIYVCNVSALCTSVCIRHLCWWLFFFFRAIRNYRFYFCNLRDRHLITIVWIQKNMTQKKRMKKKYMNNGNRLYSTMLWKLKHFHFTITLNLILTIFNSNIKSHSRQGQCIDLQLKWQKKKTTTSLQCYAMQFEIVHIT